MALKYKYFLPFLSLFLLLGLLENHYDQYKSSGNETRQPDDEDEASKVFLAVSAFDGMEANYMDMRRLKSFAEHEGESPELRRAVCRAILSSPYFFDQHKVVTANEAGDSLWRYIMAGFSKPYEYKQCYVTAHGESFPEQAFVCSAWNRESRKMESYFVSPEYRLRNASSRFVFANNEKRTMVIVAVAEEPAKIAGPVLLAEENDFFSRVQSEKTDVPDANALQSREETSHAICDLSTAQRFRLCGIILHTEAFREEVRFPSPEDKSESSCTKLKMRIQTGSDGPYTKAFYQWAVKCNAMDIRTRASVPFYISVGLGHDKFFVCRKVGKKVEAVNEYYVPHSLLQQREGETL